MEDWPILEKSKLSQLDTEVKYFHLTKLPYSNNFIMHDMFIKLILNY